MIQLTCTHCQTVLSIDDAFAGGVCRCQHCGTIQTVPSHLKNGDAVNAGVSEARTGATGPKALYQSHRVAGRSDETGSGTGLEDLADVVASSGLGDSRLSSSARGRKSKRRASVDAAVAAPVPRSQMPMILMIAGAALALAIGVTIWWLAAASGKRSAQTAQTSGGVIAGGDANAGAVTAAITGPQFCGVPLSGSSIVFLLDRGDSAKDVFDAMKEATYKSIASLGSDHKFQVLLWDNKTGDAGYPSGTTTYATSENLDACRKALDDVTAEHQSSIQGPLTQAVSEGPDAIVIVTAKGFELDDAFVSSVQGIVQSNPIKLYTLSLRTESSALETLAKKSGGTYKCLTDGALKAAGGE
jgi:hypothetical protein